MTLLFRFAIVFISIFTFSTTHATDRSNETGILDVDASGEVDALTDGLLLLRSMFGLSDDALTTGVVSPDCVDCDATKISQYITSVEGKTYADLNSTDDQNISGSSLDGTTLTIGIENGQSETVDLSSLEDGTGITAEQASAIEANTAKVGITADQAAAIAANTEKVGTDDQNISDLTLDGTTLTIGLERGGSTSIDLAPLTNCSATQDGSRVIIRCNDGTSGILASAGTVVTYPEGQSPPVDIEEIPTGAIVVQDAAGVILGEYWTMSDDAYFTKLPGVNGFNNINALLENDHVNQDVVVKIRSGFLWYNEVGCTGTVFIERLPNEVHLGPNNTYLIAASPQHYAQLMKSKYNMDSQGCIDDEEAFSGYVYPAVPYYFADEIINAVYPIALEQLPQGFLIKAPRVVYKDKMKRPIIVVR